LIHRILRDERRDRYNHFLSHGFPRWNGRDYYYSRFRPTFAMVVVFLVLVSSGMHYVIQVLNWRTQKARVERLRRSALASAWGAWFQSPADATKSSKQKIPAEKKVRVPVLGFENMPPAPSARDVAKGKVDWDAEAEKVRNALQSFVPGDGSQRLVEIIVYGDGSMALIDPETQEMEALEPLCEKDAPSFMSTWPFLLIKSLTTRRAESGNESAPSADTDTPAPEESEAAAAVTDDAPAKPTKAAKSSKSTGKTTKSSAKRRKRTTKA